MKLALKPRTSSKDLVIENDMQWVLAKQEMKTLLKEKPFTKNRKLHDLAKTIKDYESKITE